jgi:hypothetical protein
MSRHVFVWGRDQEGATGWVLKNMPHFDASFGDTIGHDCMEHLPGGLKHGAIADEMLALGARLYLRVESGWWYAQNFFVTPTQTWTGEVMRQLEYILFNGTTQPGPVRSVPTEDEIGEEMELIIAESVRKGVEKFNEEFGHDEYELRTLDLIDPDGELAKNLADWMRVGVRAAMQRWNSPAGSHYDAAMIMEDLARRVERIGTRHEEGEELVVEINEARMRVDVCKRDLSEVYPEEYA